MHPVIKVILTTLVATGTLFDSIFDGFGDAKFAESMITLKRKQDSKTDPTIVEITSIPLFEPDFELAPDKLHKEEFLETL